MKTQTKKSQVTLLILLGLVLVSIVIFLYYITSQSETAKTKKGAEQSQQLPLEVMPIINYVASCLDKNAKEGVELIGKQGGYIYRSQGGAVEPIGEGTDYVLHKGYKTAYLITPPLIKPPKYPWEKFPYNGSDVVNFMGYFGQIIRFPDLFVGSQPIKAQLESYIDNNIIICIDNFKNFNGYDIKQGAAKSIVNLARDDVSVKLDFPLEIKNKNTGEIIEKNEFNANVDVRLKTIYFFVRNLIYQDTTDINFDINDIKNEGASLSIRVDRDVNINGIPSKDDVITVIDNESYISGKPFEFSFARQNRCPALFYFNNTPDPFPDLLNGYFVYPYKVMSADSGINDTNITSISTHPVLPSKAADPDEDELKIYYICENAAGTSICNVNQTNNCDGFNCEVDRDAIFITVNVTDGEFADYKKLTVKRA